MCRTIVLFLFFILTQVSFICFYFAFSTLCFSSYKILYCCKQIAESPPSAENDRSEWLIRPWTVTRIVKSFIIYKLEIASNLNLVKFLKLLVGIQYWLYNCLVFFNHHLCGWTAAHWWLPAMVLFFFLFRTIRSSILGCKQALFSCSKELFYVLSPESVCFLSSDVLPVCVVAGWCPRWRRCQPWRPAQCRLHIQHRTQQPSGNIQRSGAPRSLIVWLTQRELGTDQFIYYVLPLGLRCLQQVLLQPWLARWLPPWSWR